MPPLIQKVTTLPIMFTGYKFYRVWTDTNLPHFHPFANLIIASCLTGSTEAVLTPLERVQMLLQDRKFHSDYKNTKDAMIKIRPFGLKEYYRGLACVLFRNGASNVMFFGLRGELKEFFQSFQSKQIKPELSQSNRCNNQDQPHNSDINTNRDDSCLTTGQNDSLGISMAEKSFRLIPFSDDLLFNFLSGAVLGSCISTIFYPLSVVRIQIQTRAPGTGFLSIIDAFKTVYRERGMKFSGFFRGCSINILRQFLSWGINNCCYEKFYKLFNEL